MQPILDLVIVRDDQKDPELFDDQLQALARLNRQPLADGRVRLTVIDQRGDDPAALARQCRLVLGVHAGPYEGGVTVIGNDHPRIDTGRGRVILWNLMADLCGPAACPDRAEYVMLLHQEALPGPEYLARLCGYLRSTRPVVCLGHQRCLGAGGPGSRGVHRRVSSDPAISSFLRQAVRDPALDLARAMASVETTNWPMIDEDRYRRSILWFEDIFAVRYDFLDATGFIGHGRELYFQDVYDLMSSLIRELARRRLAPPVHRFTEAAVYHLHHRKTYDHLCHTVAHWFHDRPERFGDLALGDLEAWGELIAWRGKPEAFEDNPLIRFRRRTDGTAGLWERGLRQYLDAGGERTVRSYMENWSREANRPVSGTVGGQLPAV